MWAWVYCDCNVFNNNNNNYWLLLGGEEFNVSVDIPVLQ